MNSSNRERDNSSERKRKKRKREGSGGWEEKGCGCCPLFQLTDPPLPLSLCQHTAARSAMFIFLFYPPSIVNTLLFSPAQPCGRRNPCLRLHTAREKKKHTHYETMCRMARRENSQKHFTGTRWGGKKRSGDSGEEKKDFTRQSNVILKPYIIYVPTRHYNTHSIYWAFYGLLERVLLIGGNTYMHVL